MLFAHLNFSADGEHFEVPKEAFEKLQNYVFSQKFAVVIDSCDSRSNFRKYYYCIYHDIDTQNNRKFDKHVDIKKKFINRQRKLIRIKNLNCK